MNIEEVDISNIGEYIKQIEKAKRKKSIINWSVGIVILLILILTITLLIN